MPAPTRVAWVAGTNAGAATLTLTNPSGAQAGDRIVAFISHTGAAATITDYQGWTLVSILTFNTRRWHILERAYASSYPNLTLSTGEGMLWATAALRATSGYSLGSTTLGTAWKRVDNGGSINTTQAPSVTVGADTLALGFFSETSTAAEVEANTTLSGTGWSKWFWSKATAGDANPINYVAFAEPSAGASGTPITTWLNNSNNGAGVQVLVPQVSDGPVLTATGSLTLGLTATVSVGVARTASASLALAGSATSTSAVSRTASAGLTVDADGLMTVGVSRTASSALGLSATAVVAGMSITRTAVVTGELTLTGDVTPVLDRVAEVAGALVLSAQVSTSISRTAEAILTLSGVGVIVPTLPDVLTLTELVAVYSLTPLGSARTLEEA